MDEAKTILENETPENTQSEVNTQTEPVEYDFLNNKPSPNSDDIITSQFDIAFKKSSPLIQNYILSDKLEENIKLICKIEKLDEDKAKIVIENITVSILVGLLPISEAKDTMIESFRSSGIILESFSASMIMKSIDTYILSDIRKQILESKLDEKREIRHLTLKEKKEESAKEELRKILLEKTGNLDGRGQPLIQYKPRDIPKPEKVNLENSENQKPKPELNRETLLQKLNLENITDTQKALDRMREIKNAEINRLKDEKVKDEEIIQKDEVVKANPEDLQTDQVSDNLATLLKAKLNNKENETVNLDVLREERGLQEAKEEKMKNLKELNRVKDAVEIKKDYAGSDPYRETIT